MLGVLFGFLSLVLVVGGVFGVYEARSYTDDQRARAPRLWLAYVGCSGLLCVFGVGSVAWILNGGAVFAVSGIASIVAALPCLVQYRLHQALDVERSPLTDRLSRTVARKLNVPEH